jgi:glutamate--cysteine ligase
MSDVRGDGFTSHLREHAFGLGTVRRGAPGLGAEVEFIPVDASTRRVVPIESPDARSSLPVVREVARRAGWREERSAKSGLPEIVTCTGGRITYEPGGQVEYASAPSTSLSALVADLQSVTGQLRDGLEDSGIDSVFAGIDPVNRIESVPLRVYAERYRRMDSHFASIGPHGARMMRQTASIQVSVDLGATPLARWDLLNAVAPFLAAMFANAPQYGGEPTGEASVRRLAWNNLDPSRTGLPWNARCPVEAYASFAMGAGCIVGPVADAPFPSFATLVARNEADEALWAHHLTTLFPEVRPRGYFEVRSIDALEPEWYAAPLVMVAGLSLDAATAQAARELAGDPDASLLETAGRLAMADSRLADVSAELARLALRGCESLGPSFVAPADLDRARAFFEVYTWAGRSPADARPVGAA